MLRKLQELWCSWTHGGGQIKRDPAGLINWQCSKCGRWADPVPAEVEKRVVDADLRRCPPCHGDCNQGRACPARGQV